MKKLSEYMVYGQQDEILAFGPSDICARTLGISKASFYSHLSRQNGYEKNGVSYKNGYQNYKIEKITLE